MDRNRFTSGVSMKSLKTHKTWTWSIYNYLIVVILKNFNKANHIRKVVPWNLTNAQYITKLTHNYLPLIHVEYRLISKKGEGTFSEVLKA